MWLARPERVVAYLTSTQLWVADPGGRWEITNLEGVGQAAHRLRDRLAGSRVDLWVSGGLVRPLVTQPIGGARDRSELEHALTAKLAHTGELGPREALRVAHRPQPGAEHVLCAVLSERLLAELDTLDKGGLAVASVRPWWILGGLDGSPQSRPQTQTRTQMQPQTGSGVLCAMLDGEALQGVRLDPKGCPTHAWWLGGVTDVEQAFRAVRRWSQLAPQSVARLFQLTQPRSSGPQEAPKRADLMKSSVSEVWSTAV